MTLLVVVPVITISANDVVLFDRFCGIVALAPGDVTWHIFCIAKAGQDGRQVPNVEAARNKISKPTRVQLWLPSTFAHPCYLETLRMYVYLGSRITCIDMCVKHVQTSLVPPRTHRDDMCYICLLYMCL